MIVPDLVARPLAEAVLMAKEAGLSVTLVKAEPAFHRDTLVWRDDFAYVLKQINALDHKTLIIGCQFEGGVHIMAHKIGSRCMHRLWFLRWYLPGWCYL